MTKTKKLIESERTSKGIFLLLPALLLIVFTNCKRTSKDEVMLGSNYQPASASFNVTSSLQAYKLSDNSTTNVGDFQYDSVYYKAKFNESVSWTLTISGLTSGATKTITGLSDSLDYTNAIWSGNSTSPRFFVNGEQAVAELSFLGSSIAVKDTITLSSAIVYGGKTINGVKHIFVDGFEGSGKILETSHDFADDPYNFYGVNGDTSIDGSFSYKFGGLDVNSNSWLSGSNTRLTALYGFISPTLTNPEELFVNIYVFGTGKANTSVQLKLYEQETLPVPSYDQYKQDQNDGYVYDIAVEWIGWKLVSARYSDFKRANDPATGGNGNGIKEPWKVSGVGYNLNCFPTPGKEVGAYVDYLILTEKGKFIP
jgi:hypothetical protein